MSEECQELKNIKYQTMLLNNNSKFAAKANSDNLDDFLRQETANNKNKPWSKLGRSTKLKKLDIFVTRFSNENELTEVEKKKLVIYLNESLNRKKLQRVKDVNYDVKSGSIKAIPGLQFNKDKKKFTLKRIDKKKSTMKGLAPSRRKNKIDIKDN
uniref:Uncharacterized protein n=1 Tax=viral metagenome TaxID=1070528 RepID=A0A6C0C5X7_9ZZZZ